MTSEFGKILTFPRHWTLSLTPEVDEGKIGWPLYLQRRWAVGESSVEWSPLGLSRSRQERIGSSVEVRIRIGKKTLSQCKISRIHAYAAIIWIRHCVWSFCVVTLKKIEKIAATIVYIGCSNFGAWWLCKYVDPTHPSCMYAYSKYNRWMKLTTRLRVHLIAIVASPTHYKSPILYVHIYRKLELTLLVLSSIVINAKDVSRWLDKKFCSKMLYIHCILYRAASPEKCARIINGSYGRYYTLVKTKVARRVIK